MRLLTVTYESSMRVERIICIPLPILHLSKYLNGLKNPCFAPHDLGPYYPEPLVQSDSLFLWIYRAKQASGPAVVGWGTYEGIQILAHCGNEDAITRNRYGAEVLNSTSCLFVDIDEPVFRLWQVFRRVRSREQKKQAILEFVGRRLKKPDLNGFGIRVYETHSGIRLILEGKAMDPRSKESKSLLRSFHADRLYATLCRKRSCYRARLTPKPHRIKMKSIRLSRPYEETDKTRIGE